MNSGHVWTLAYVDNEWYYIDPTWIDDDESIEALKNKDYQASSMVSSWYMIPVGDTTSSYSIQRRVDFTMQNSIPKRDRVSRMSILEKTQPEDDEEGYNEEERDRDEERLGSILDDERVDVPETGLFTSNDSFAMVSITLVAFVSIVSATLLVWIVCNRIINKNSVRNFNSNRFTRK